MKGTEYVTEKNNQNQADVLLVTPTSIEAQAVLTLIHQQGGISKRLFIKEWEYFDLGEIGGMRTFLVQSESGMVGPGGATLVVHDAIKALSPKAVIMVGIAFGLRPDEQELGDILVSRQLMGYEVQRVAADHSIGEVVKGLIEPTGMREREEGSTDPERWATIFARGDRVMVSPRLLNRFRASVFDWSGPTVTFGLILSGDKLVDNIHFREKLLSIESDAIGSELEGTSIYSAAYREKVDWILVKAICDWAGGDKYKDKALFQKQAAENAARFTLHVLQKGGLAGPPARPSIPSPVQRTIGAIYCTYSLHSSYVIAVAWEPDGNRIASAGGDGVVQVWNADTGQTLLTYRGHARLLERVNMPSTIYTVAWSPDGSRLASAGTGPRVLVWDSATGQDIIVYSKHAGLLPSVYTITWSPDGTRIASACSSAGLDRTIHVWKTESGDTILRCATYVGYTLNFSVLAIAWSPDGTRIAAHESGKRLHIWDAVTGKLISSLPIPSNMVSSLVWSPDSRLLATANSDHTAQIWDTKTRALLLAYAGHSDSIRALAWSSDGTRIASASNDKTVQIWDAATGKGLYSYHGHNGWTTSLAWSPDGTRIASASNDKTVQIWQAV